MDYFIYIMAALGVLAFVTAIILYLLSLRFEIRITLGRNKSNGKTPNTP
jgi:hypothetical protein